PSRPPRRELEPYRALRRVLQQARTAAPEAETALARVTRSVRARRRRAFAFAGLGAMAPPAAPPAVAQCLSARLPHAVPATAGGDGFALRGARVDSLDGRPVATVVYQ